ncbi:MAG: 30S ribosome-binding factor RbfA [Eubacterium sp.]
MAGFHIDRISEDIKREIISLMRELKDPRVAGKMLTVVNVTVSNDLSYAKVYISAMEGIETAKKACKGLDCAQGYIRRALSNNLHLRKAPQLAFVADDSIEKGMEIFEKLKDASNEN